MKQATCRKSADGSGVLVMIITVLAQRGKEGPPGNGAGAGG